jgi:hypothetical protein
MFVVQFFRLFRNFRFFFSAPYAAGFSSFSTGGNGQATSLALFHAASD